jgi:CO/xanthine dehydrogenase Mo-binding subunit
MGFRTGIPASDGMAGAERMKEVIKSPTSHNHITHSDDSTATGLQPVLLVFHFTTIA